MSEVFVHPTACIDRPVEIGAGTRIWHFCHVMPGAFIGRDCVLGQNVFVGEGVVIGNGVKIQNNVSIYSGVTLEDEVFCGPSAVFTNVRTPRAGVPRKSPEQRSDTLVRRGATVGANATVVCGVTLGRYAFAGAGSVVASDVGDFVLVTGNPARPAGWRCVCGEIVRLESGKGICEACGARYLYEADGLQEEP